jgi:formiminotetrahydrofolate cyclodeaminase
MELNAMDKAQLKAVIRELITEDITLFKAVIKEILIDEKIILPADKFSRRERVEKLIEEDFERFNDVFNALA